MAADLATLRLQHQQQQLQKMQQQQLEEQQGAGLHSVRLAGNSQLADFGVAALLAGGATRGSLQHLDVSHCKGLSSDALQLPATVGRSDGQAGHSPAQGWQAQWQSCIAEVLRPRKWS
jgi:hypothetical protein